MLIFLFFRSSLRRTSERLSLALSNEITFPSGTGFKNASPQRISSKRKEIEEYVIDETLIKKVGSELIWFWVAIESKNKEILGISISKERNMFVAEHLSPV